MKLEIRSPEAMIFSGKVTMLCATAVDGEIGILPNHASLATRLAPGDIRYHLESGEEKALTVECGFLIVEANHADILHF